MSVDYRGLVSGRADLVSLWHRICDDADSRNAAWIAGLRGKGFKAAHPNDGWVNREDRYLTPCYPQFNDGVKAGDLIMLGWSFDEKSWRPVRIAAITKNFSERWWFDDVAREKGDLDGVG